MISSDGWKVRELSGTEQLSGFDLDRVVAELKGLSLRQPFLPDDPTWLVEDAEGPGCAWNYLPYYSSDWREAGTLLEEMAAASGMARWEAKDVIEYGLDAIDQDAENILGLTPEKIARWYVAWREAQKGDD